MSYAAAVVNKNIFERQGIRVKPQHLSAGRGSRAGLEIGIAGDIEEAVGPDHHAAGTELFTQAARRGELAEQFSAPCKHQDFTRSARIVLDEV